MGLPGQAIRFGRGLSVTKVSAETVREAEEAGELPTYSADRLPTRFNGMLGGDITIDFLTLDGADIKRSERPFRT